MKRRIYTSGLIALSCMFLWVAFSSYSCKSTLDIESHGQSPVSGWLELPAMSQDSGLKFLRHDRTDDGVKSRDWSCAYDTLAMISHWVAYPLNRDLIGTGKRSDAWGLDPKLPAEKQAVLYRGFKSDDPDVRYDRGHQIPSADRLDREDNIRTFYFTNMTPQLSQLNQKGWAQLEDLVRDRAMTVDTLYVVTGCSVEGSDEYAYDNEGKKVLVPSAYYKALLSYRMTKEGPEYKACGFWMEHSPFKGDVIESILSVDKLEEKTGLDFFVNLKDKIGKKAAASVESSIDEWYYENK